MENRKPGKREPSSEVINCNYSSETELVKRENFNHNKKSEGTSIIYKCSSCKRENLLNKTQEVKP